MEGLLSFKKFLPLKSNCPRLVMRCKQWVKLESGQRALSDNALVRSFGTSLKYSLPSHCASWIGSHLYPCKVFQVI